MTQWDIVWAVVTGLAIYNLLEVLVATVAVEVQSRIRSRKFDKVMAELERAFEEQDRLRAAAKPVKKAVVKKKPVTKRK
jgi:hypothetical protein